MKLGFCPECTKNLDFLFDDKDKITIQKKKKFDCPNCGTPFLLTLTGIKKQVINSEAVPPYHEISMGIEVESFSINLANLEIRSMAPIYPKAGIEKDEQYIEDQTIGSEYNSGIYDSINEAYFRIKAGLRKYFVNIEEDEKYRIALLGSYSEAEDVAGVHYHIGFGKKRGINSEEIKLIAPHIHQQIPFIIAMTANSPIFNNNLTGNASNRYLHNHYQMFNSLSRISLPYLLENTTHYDEMYYSPPKDYKKPYTLEIRVTDSTIPEYIVAGLFIVYISIVGALKRKKLWDHFDMDEYQQDKWKIAQIGVRAPIRWDNILLSFPKYIDMFFNFYRAEIKESDVSQDILDVFRLAKKGWNMADIVRTAYQKIQLKFPKENNLEINKKFCFKYLKAQERNLNGENLFSFARYLNIDLPNVDNIILGKGFRQKSPL
ncbi:MAG: hypothetical protein EAX96_02225 [Candidatus Lokiarchaeota archaeon]|nr:hypothetical protein [Candidatus Lokiarchaeota archaeon]